jgi:type IV secretion system protein VirB1
LILAAAVLACAANVAPATLNAIVAVESGGRRWVLHDNTAGRRYHARSQAQAAAWARRLLARGHSVDVGLGQINSANLRRYGVDPGAALDPCTNLRLAGRILTTDYRAAVARWRPGQWALLHALSAYHHGSLKLDTAYLARYHDRGGRSAAVDAADRPGPVGYHFIAPAAVRMRQAAPRIEARDDAVYRRAALAIAIR